MRKTLEINNDVLRAAKARAKRQHKSVGEVISELASLGLAISVRGQGSAEPIALYGFRPFSGGETIVTNDMIDRLRDGGAY